MKPSFLDKHFETIIYTMFGVGISLIFIGIPVSNWYSAGVKQKAINSECGTNYSQLEVMFSGESLTELCRIKNQELIFKQK
jgi:hypothetical protein